MPNTCLSSLKLDTIFSRPSTATTSARLRTGRSTGGSAGRRRRRDRGGRRPGNVAVRSTRGEMVMLKGLMGRGGWRILTGSTSMKLTEFIISFNIFSFNLFIVNKYQDLSPFMTLSSISELFLSVFTGMSQRSTILSTFLI